MQRIDFENNVTKASAETFNELQDNIENAIEDIENAIEDIDQIFTNMKTVTLNNEWRTAFKPLGGTLIAQIPIFNPNNSAPIINISSAEIYNGSWQTVTPVLAFYNTNEIGLQLQNSLSLTNGDVYLVRFNGTITCE